MFIKVTTLVPRKYVKIVESFRDEAGKHRQRVLATLGRLENIREGAADAVINGLLKANNKQQSRYERRHWRRGICLGTECRGCLVAQ